MQNKASLSIFFLQQKAHHCRTKKIKQAMIGFTLLEILIALFIFTILSTMLMSALHTVINAQSVAEKNAERLRSLQMALLIMSRDIEQTVNRPIMNASGKEEVAFIGTAKSFTFTHTGIANVFGLLTRSALQRTGYAWDNHALVRLAWPVLDQSPQTKSEMRVLLSNVIEAHFRYVDKEGQFHNEWPTDEAENQALPRAISVNLTLSKWGTLSQLYVIPAQPISASSPPAMPQS